MNNPEIYIVIAAYNEAESIRSVIQKVLAVYPRIVLVNDGSTDDTAEMIHGLPLIVLRHLINRGQGAALQTGIQYALDSGADVIVTFDADGQHAVEDIKALVDPILNWEYDLTLGSRFLGEAHNIPFFRKLLLRAGVYFTRLLSGIPVTDVHNGLRAFSREAAQTIHLRIDRMGHASEILDQIRDSGMRYKEVPVNIYYTHYSLRKGQSSFNAVKILFQLFFNRYNFQ